MISEVRRTIPTVRFSLDEAQKAEDEWRFNCGPGALCAILGKTPDEIRPFLGDFETKKYMSPSMMKGFFLATGYKFTWNVIPYTIPPMNLWKHNSLIRVQWAGPWTEAGAYPIAKSRHTHWIGCKHVWGAEVHIFDINAMCVGGWMPLSEWEGQLVPWLLSECEPKADGRWWQTHIVEVL